METILNFFPSPDYLYLLFAFENKIPNLNELLLAIIKQMKEINKFDSHNLNEFYETLSILTKNDYTRLKLLLKRIQNL